MRCWFAIAITLYGCVSERPQRDAGLECAVPTEIPSCAATCGNGELDVCYMLEPECGVVVADEACDGAVSCEQAGFYGGTAICASDCSSIDDTECNACAPGLVDCQTFAAPLPTALGVSGSHVAAARSRASTSSTA